MRLLVSMPDKNVGEGTAQGRWAGEIIGREVYASREEVECMGMSSGALGRRERERIDLFDGTAWESSRIRGLPRDRFSF